MAIAWPEDLAKLSIDELAALHRANEVWAKDLKQRIKILTDGKALGAIGEDDYANGMKSINKDIAECVRRSQLLCKL